MFGTLMRTIQKKKVLPQLSDTEKVAMEAGTIWMDAELFSGNPDFPKMMSQDYLGLSPEEQAFLDGPCEELIKMVDAWEVSRTRRVPEDVWNFLCTKGFFGLNTPKPWGLGFSPLGKSAVMTKLAVLPQLINTIVVIPNSLGASELIAKYGTDSQKDEFLPGLVNGDLVPCFGLTEPTAGSDAASIKAEAEVFKDTDGELKFKMNFEKRYITNAPISNFVSLACKVRDPQNLMGKGEDLGITVVLLQKGAEGLTIGNHHEPMGIPFANGPIVGKDVIATIDDVIGGEEYIGQGWKMLMECLSGGRAISLPAGGVGGTKAVAGVMGAYSMVRQQFGIPIGYMEGIQTNVAKGAAMAYAMEAARIYTCCSLNNGEKPSVLSAIMKAYSTEMASDLSKDAMDVLSGAAVQNGPNNIVQRGYVAAPIGITVEGANIMTRTLIVFGQGAIRCHPHALDVVNAVEADDVKAFRKSMIGWIGHMIMTKIRTTVRGLTRGWSAMLKPGMGGPLAKYKRRLAWSSARYALLTDRSMITLGGKLKMKGALTGRFADALAWMYIATATMRRFEAEGQLKEDLPVVEWALDYAFNQIQEAYEGIYDNWDVPVVGWFMRTFGKAIVRLNPMGRMPTDKQNVVVAGTIQKFDAQYERIMNEVYQPDADEPGAGRLMEAFKLVTEATPVFNKLVAASRARTIPKAKGAQLVANGLEAGIITAEEADLMKRAEEARSRAIQVDVFTKEQYYPEWNDFGTLDNPRPKSTQSAPSEKAA